MPLPSDFVSHLQCPETEALLERMKSLTSEPTQRSFLELRNELKPVDLFCYLWARFGPPNGIQNFLRKDHSDNLVHWDWTLQHDQKLLGFWGTNFRTDLFIIGSTAFAEADKLDLVAQIKSDYKNFGPKMAAVRSKLEHWTEFVNPYWRLTRAISSLRTELATIDLTSPFEHEFNTPTTLVEQHESWKSVAAAQSRAFGLCFGIRSMLPVWAEAFINLLIFSQARPDIKLDTRLMESIYRQQIDVRVRALHINCIGFEKAVDYKAEEFKAFQRLINERNDLLHGNVVPEKQRFNEVLFLRNIPVFNEYRSLWDRTFAVDAKAVGLDQLETEVKTVQDFIGYILSCLKPKTREMMEYIARRRDLARNDEDGRFGILFPEHLVDSRPSSQVPQSQDAGIEGEV